MSLSLSFWLCVTPTTTKTTKTTTGQAVRLRPRPSPQLPTRTGLRCVRQADRQRWVKAGFSFKTSFFLCQTYTHTHTHTAVFCPIGYSLLLDESRDLLLFPVPSRSPGRIQSNHLSLSSTSLRVDALDLGDSSLSLSLSLALSLSLTLPLYPSLSLSLSLSCPLITVQRNLWHSLSLCSPQHLSLKVTDVTN